MGVILTLTPALRAAFCFSDGYKCSWSRACLHCRELLALLPDYWHPNVSIYGQGCVAIFLHWEMMLLRGGQLPRPCLEPVLAVEQGWSPSSAIFVVSQGVSIPSWCLFSCYEAGTHHCNTHTNTVLKIKCIFLVGATLNTTWRGTSAVFPPCQPR